MLKNEEEFNNFMHKVTEINSIVKKLSSANVEQNKIGITEADEYLGTEKFFDEDLELKITVNKTIINKIKEKEPQNENEMDPETFKREIERDAKKRFEDKKIRREKAETLKVQGNKAFRRKEYEKAIICYTKAIEHIKDSGIIYLNRALCYMELKLFDKAENDCKWALKINENSLKALTYLAKIYFEKSDLNEANKYLKEAIEKHPEEKQAIQVFVTDLDSQNYK